MLKHHLEIKSNNIKHNNVENNLKLLHENLLCEFMPPSIIINSSNEIVNIIGNAEKLFLRNKEPYGKSIYTEVRLNLSEILKVCIDKARKENKEVVYDNVSFMLNGYSAYVKVVIKPYCIESNLYILIKFDNIGHKENEVKNFINDFRDQRQLTGDDLTYDQLKTEFFSNLSHELRTPINVILSSLQLMEGYLSNNYLESNVVKISKHKDIMKQNCYRLLRLVNNMIDITRIDSGFFDMKLCNYNIVYLIEEIIQSVVVYLDEKNTTILFDTDVEEKNIACDPELIERILLNLLSNSIKCTRPGDNITVYLYDYNSFVRITVKDTGIGIPEDKLPIIFERFRQADKSLTRIHEGSGIGLAIAKSLVEMHGGNIAVTSELGKGTEFIIDLPALTLSEFDKTDSISNSHNRNSTEKIQIEFSDIYK